MAITQAVCDSFKKELLEGEHDFRSSGGDQFKLALYGSSASLSNTTTAYTTSQEVSASGTYSAGVVINQAQVLLPQTIHPSLTSVI